MTPILDPNSLIYIPHPRVNCLKIIPFTVVHTYIAHIWQYPPPPPRHPVKEVHGDKRQVALVKLQINFIPLQMQKACL